MRFSSHSVKFHTTAEASAVELGLLESMAHQLNSQLVAPNTGDIYNVMQLITQQSPQIPLSCLAVKSLLDMFSLTGKPITSDGTHPGVVLYAQKHDASQADARGPGGSHVALTAEQGHVVLNSISATKGGFVSVNFTLHGVTADGSAFPFTVAYNANLPVSPITNELYALGKAQVLGTTVDRINSVEIAFNPAIEFPNDADTIWPSLIDIHKIDILTTIVTEDPAWLNPSVRIGYGGTFTDSGNTFINFLEYETSTQVEPVSGGAFTDFGVGNHIKGTLRGLVHVSDHLQASGQGISQTQIQVASVALSGSAPIVWDTAATYDLGPEV